MRKQRVDINKMKNRKKFKYQWKKYLFKKENKLKARLGGKIERLPK